MPLKKDKQRQNEGEKYCSYCYKNGEFLQKDLTLEQMKEFVTNHLIKKGFPKFLAKFMSTKCNNLERWKKPNFLP